MNTSTTNQEITQPSARLSFIERHERLVDAMFGSGYDVYGEEKIEIKIIPRFTLGKEIILKNGNKLISRNEYSEIEGINIFAPEISAIQCTAEAIEGDFCRPYIALYKKDFVNLKNMIKFLSLVMKILQKRQVKYTVYYIPHKENPEKFLLFNEKDPINSENMLSNFKEFVRKNINIYNFCPNESYKEPFLNFVFNL